MLNCFSGYKGYKLLNLGEPQKSKTCRTGKPVIKPVRTRKLFLRPSGCAQGVIQNRWYPTCHPSLAGRLKALRFHPQIKYSPCAENTRDIQQILYMGRWTVLPYEADGNGKNGKNIFPDLWSNQNRKMRKMGSVGMLMSGSIQGYLIQLYRCGGWATIRENGKTIFFCCFSTILQNRKTVFPDLQPNRIWKTGNVGIVGILMSSPIWGTFPNSLGTLVEPK